VPLPILKRLVSEVSDMLTGNKGYILEVASFSNMQKYYEKYVLWNVYPPNAATP